MREDLGLFAVEAALCVGGGEVLGGEAETPETPGGVPEDDDLLGFIEITGIAGDIQAARKVAGSSAVPGAPGDEDEGAGRGVDGGRSYREEAKERGQDIRIDLYVCIIHTNQLPEAQRSKKKKKTAILTAG